METKAMTTDDLLRQIQETERLIAVYRDAKEVIVGTQDEIYSRRGLTNRTTLMAAEIGDQIVRILGRRLAAIRAEFAKARRRISKGSSQSCRRDRWLTSNNLYILLLHGDQCSARGRVN
jgi:hypothetical protein